MSSDVAAYCQMKVTDSLLLHFCVLTLFLLEQFVVLSKTGNWFLIENLFTVSLAFTCVQT